MNLALAVRISGDGGQEGRHLAQNKGADPDHPPKLCAGLGPADLARAEELARVAAPEARDHAQDEHDGERHEAEEPGP